MSTSSIARRSLVAAVGGLAALTLAAGGAQAAQASTPSTVTATSATSSTTSYYLPGYGSTALMPTWIVGATHLCAFNGGSNWGLLKVKSTSGANAEYISVPPYSQRCIDRWWFGVPVWVTNQSYTPLFASGS